MSRLVLYTAVLVYLEFSSNSKDLSCLCLSLHPRGPSVCCRDFWSRWGLMNQDPFFHPLPIVAPALAQTSLRVLFHTGVFPLHGILFEAPLFYFKLLASIGSTEMSKDSQRRAVWLLLLKKWQTCRFCFHPMTYFLGVGGMDSLVPSLPKLAALGRGTVCGYETILRCNNNKKG